MRLTILGNLAGAPLTFVYFNFLGPSARGGRPSGGAAVWVFFVVSFFMLAVAGRMLGAHWTRPVVQVEGAIPEGAQGEELRRRALLVPGFFAGLSFMAWLLASLIWGVLWPMWV